MKTKLRSETLGEYFLNSFIIKCNKKIDFDDISKSDDINSLGTFFHEYMHFLQNISTTYGCMSMTYYYANTMNILFEISNSKNSKIPRVIPNNNESVEYLANIYNLTLGDTDLWTYECYDDIRIVDIQINSEEWIEDKYKNATTPTIVLETKKNGKIVKKNFQFGAMAVMESMASLFERIIYNKRFLGKQVQYNICEILWDYLLPRKFNQIHLVFLACECALMYDNPGLIFYSILKFCLCEENDELNKAKIIDAFRNSIRPSYIDTYNNYYNEMIKHFDDLVPPNNMFCKDLSEHVKGFLKKIYDLRTLNVHFLTDIISGDNEISSKVLIIDLMKNTNAIPLIIDSDNEILSGLKQQLNKMDMTNNLALYSFNQFWGIRGKNRCFMLEICEKNSKDLIDNRCTECPW